MRNRPKSCRVCGRGEAEVGRVSWQGYCAKHGRERMETNLDELASRSGPHFYRWRVGMARAAGYVVLDTGRDEA